MHSIGIIGYGHFGAFLAELAKKYVPEAQVHIHSARFTPNGTTFFSLEETCSSDVVIIASAIHTFEETLRKVVPLLSETSVLLEVSTVKMHPVGLLAPLRGTVRFVATHPMFGPQSFEKRGGSLQGMRIVIAEHTLTEEELAAMRAFLEKLGLIVVLMSAEEHDKKLAATLFLTHYVGQVIARAGFERTDIDTISFGFLMDAVESVKNDTKLFADVYRFNPFCKEVIERFEKGEEEVAQKLLL